MAELKDKCKQIPRGSNLPGRVPGNACVTVMLVDAHAIWRGGVRCLLAGTEFSVVGEASSPIEALHVARQRRPQIILLDIGMTGADGFETLQTLTAADSCLKIVIMTTYDNPSYVARAAAGGAAGYLLKSADSDTVLATLRSVAAGKMLLGSKDLARSLRGLCFETAGADDLIEPLTEREAVVLRLVATGLSNREIASCLFISEGTAKTHVGHVIGKLGVADRVQAAVWAARHGRLAERIPMPNRQLLFR